MNTQTAALQADHKIRINRVFEYIENNLESDLSLQKIAAIAFFSPFHFHRVFKFVTGETLNAYVTRKRIEKSAGDLLHKSCPIPEIAHNYGFNDTATYSKTFKKYFGVSPTQFKKQNPNRFSKIRQLDSKNGQGYPQHEKYICTIANLKKWITMNANIKIEETKKMELAYVSCIGPQTIGNAFNKLIKWATPLGLMHGQTKMVTVYHDSFKVTPAHRVRMSASILLNGSVKISGEIGLRSIDPGRFIVGSFEIGLDEFEKSWTGLFVWMNENGYKKADREPFEIYHNNFNEHPQRKAIVDFYIPIE